MTDPMNDLRQASAEVSGVELTKLSPAAQAVFDAYKEASDGAYINGEWIQDEAGQVAAALRAAADQAIPMTKSPWSYALVPVLSAEESRKRILAIANELEAL